MIKTINLRENEKNEDVDFYDIIDRKSGSFPKEEKLVADILDDIRKNGDDALFAYMEKFDQVKISPENIEVSEDEIEKAYEEIDNELLETLKRAAENIRAYHKKQVRTTWFESDKEGISLGIKYTPIEKVGVYVPGGKASYPSTVLMDVTPAKIAGVENIYMVTPPGKDGKISAEIIVAGVEAGVDKIFKIGGAQAIAALAFGTRSVPKVSKIVGPGNIFVALAKKQVFGFVGLDSIAGPSEITVLADDTANPAFVAADMLSQAEHDEMASPVLVTDSVKIAEAVKEQLYIQLDTLPRGDIMNKSLDNYGLIIITSNMDEAIDIVNNIAPEHLEIMTAEPKDTMAKIKNAGAIFMGAYSCEPLGDYYAGPNHVLPTNGTAKFFSPLSVDDFVKRSSLIQYDEKAFKEAADDVMRFAQAEGLFAHANSVKVRV